MTRKLLFLIAFYLTIVVINAQTTTLLSTTFDDATDLTDVWTVVDADNDGATWQTGSFWGSRNGAEISRPQNTPADSKDDWLISPAVQINDGTATEISAKFYCTYYSTEYLEVRVATEGTAPEDATVVDTFEISGRQGYYGTTKSLSLPTIDADGNYCIYLHYTAAGEPSGYVEGLHINDFTWTAMASTATVQGQVIYRVDGSDIMAEGATVTIGDLSTLTDDQGNYAITDIPAGEYDITVKYIESASIGREHVVLNAGDYRTINFTLTQLNKYAVSGKIIDKDSSPIMGAVVNFEGDSNASTVSDINGTYNAEMYEGDYTITVIKNNYISQSQSITLGSDEVIDFYIDIDVQPTYSVTAGDDAARNIIVEWIAPKSLHEIAYDNGNADSDFGFGEYGDDDHIMGTIFRQTGTIYEVRWQSAEYSDGSANSLTLSVVALDADGSPTANVLHQAVVPTTHGEWNVYQLPAPIKVEEGGFMVLFGGENARLALDSGNDDDVIDYPMTQVYNNLGIGASLAYSYFDDRLSNRSRHFMIRAYCENLEVEGSTMPAITYDVWRMDASASQDDESQWTSVVSGTQALSITDSNVHSGSYRYAVKATYTALGETTDATFSNVIDHNLIADVTVNVTANSDPEHVNGASVKLSNDSYSYVATVVDGKAEFIDVEKGTYTLSIRQNGFEPVQEDGIEIIGDDVAFTLTRELIQSLDMPISLDVLVDGASAQLMWNMQPNIVENFDGDEYTDFEVNPAGSFGWSYIDNDYLIPYGFGYNQDYVQITFPHMGERMAAITFNSMATTPPLNVPNTARSGERALAFFAARPTTDEEGNVTFQWSDDYFISPELAPYRDFTFRFYAREYEQRFDDDGNLDESRTERFMVGYSTTDASSDSFIWLDEDWRRVEDIEYVEYEYAIPQEAKYVTLRSSSNDNFILLIDDVFIGVDEQVVGNSYMPVNVIGYEVYLDDNKVADTQETEYLFTGLANGTHTAGVVQKFVTGNSEQLTITFDIVEGSGVENMAIDVLSIYAVGETLYINGNYSRAMIYSISGAQVMALSGESQADISFLPHGIYVVKVIGYNGETVVAKVIR